MKKPYIKFVLCAIAFVILVGVACNIGGTDPTATSAPVEPTSTNTFQPLPTSTTAPLPSATTGAVIPTATTELPTEETYDEPPAYFIEEFDGDLNSWSYFLMSGNESQMDLYSDSGYLVFDLQGEDIYVYVLYDEYTYSYVRIDVMADNRGMNSNFISLVCNYSDRYGWYEYNISNNGLYKLYAYSEIDSTYDDLTDGGSTNINTGRDVNVYTMICDENNMALYINGYLENEFTDNKYNLREGQVGFSVNSLDVLPILVFVDYFAISMP